MKEVALLAPEHKRRQTDPEDDYSHDGQFLYRGAKA